MNLALSVIAEESYFIQSNLYKNSNFLHAKNKRILCCYAAFIEVKPSPYVKLESIDLEGSYYSSKETCKDFIKNLISLIEIK